MRPFLPSILVLAACLAFGPAAEAQTRRAERPTYTVGETWARNDGLFELTRADGRSYVFVAGPGREIHLTHDLAIQHTLRDGKVEVEFSPPVRFTWPLAVGAWGMTTSKVHVRTQSLIPPEAAGRLVEQVTWQVEGVESVAVAAGSFEAFRIVFTVSAAQLEGSATSTFERLSGPLAHLTMWYAPAIQRFVKADGTQALTPLSFQLAAVPGLARRPPPAEKAAPSRPTTPPAAPAPVPAQPPASAPPAVATPPARTPPESTPLASAPQPLQIAVASPPHQGRVQTETLVLAGVVSGAQGVSRVVVTLNGVEVGRTEEKVAPPAIPLNQALTLREGPNTIIVTATAPGGGVQQEMRTVHYERLTPLTLSIRYPEEGLRLRDPTSLVAAIATSSKGVARVSVSVNGQKVHEQQEQTPQKTLVISVPLTLYEGPNALVIQIAELDGTARTELRTVFYDKLATPAPSSSLREAWAVLIGIGKYDSATIPGLNYAVADAEAVYRTLLAAGFKKQNMLLLSDRAEQKPTLRNIRRALGSFLARGAKKDDTVLVFFAGHGATEVDPRGIERDGLAKYLVPSDADPEDLFATALPMDDIHQVFTRVEAERMVVFLDSCYSGAAGGRTFVSKKTRTGRVDEQFLERLTRAKGRVIVTAARPAEVAGELPELGHGIFTYYLIEGLKGAADLNRDGVVTLHELYEYVEQNVTQKSRAAGLNQHPVMKGELEGVLPLVRLRR